MRHGRFYSTRFGVRPHSEPRSAARAPGRSFLYPDAMLTPIFEQQ